MDIPPILKSLKPYLAHAQQIGKHDPVVAYYCRYYAVLLGIEINKTASPEDKKLIGGALGSLLDKLEAEKSKIKDQLASGGKEKVQDLAIKIFDQADLEDREGNATKITARNFYAASIFITVSKQFFPDQKLDEEWEEKLRYSKWKAADITNAIKEGRAPTPGSASEQSDLNSLLSGDSFPGSPSGSSAPSSQFPPLTAASVAASSLSSMDPLAALAALSVPTSAVQTFPNPHSNDMAWPSAPGNHPGSHGGPVGPYSYSDAAAFPPSNPSATFNPNPNPTPTQYPPPVNNGGPAPNAAPPPSKQPPPPQQTSATSSPAPRSGGINAPALSYDSLGVAPDSIDRASKHARYAQSALQFEDVTTAVKHLRQALQELGYQ